MKWIITLVLYLSISSWIWSQGSAVLHVVEEHSIRQLLDHKKSLNFQKDRKIKVWSVQLLLSRDKYLATQQVTEIRKVIQHTTNKVDWTYEAPYYRIYAGGFYTKLEAATLLNRLLESYPDAIVFKNSAAKPSDMQ